VKGRVAAIAGVAAVGLGLTACDASDSEGPEPVSGAAEEVAGVVRALERATAEKDYNEICFDLFSDQVRAQAGGVRCPSFLRRTARGIESPRIEIVDDPGGAPAILVRGRTARVRVRTRARDQAPVRDTIELVRQRDRFRISALGRVGRP